MIMGHVGFGSLFNKWIHVFHMPMFFIISGYFWKSQSFSSMLKKKTKTLLIPYFAFGVFHLIIHFIRIGSIDSHAFYLFLWENTAESGVPIAGALWFLTAMFFSEILFWCVQRINLSEMWKNIIAALIAISGMACATYLPYRLPWAFDVGMVGVGLYEIGKLLKEKWNKLLDLNSLISSLAFVLFSALGFVNGYVNLRQGLYSIWPLFWINAVGMTISLWNLSRLVYGWVTEKKLLEKPLTWIKRNRTGLNNIPLFESAHDIDCQAFSILFAVWWRCIDSRYENCDLSNLFVGTICCTDNNHEDKTEIRYW